MSQHLYALTGPRKQWETLLAHLTRRAMDGGPKGAIAISRDGLKRILAERGGDEITIESTGDKWTFLTDVILPRGDNETLSWMRDKKKRIDQPNPETARLAAELREREKRGDELPRGMPVISEGK